MTRFEQKNWRKVLRLDTNPIVKTLVISDIFIISGFGLISPIFAVFVTNQIQGGNVEVAGLASTIFLLTRSLGQLPAAQIIDKIRGERDDFWAMVIGSLLISFVPLLYLTARYPLHIYLIQFVYGLGAAISLPSWLAIFTRHIDSHREGFEWGVYNTFTDLGSAAAAAIGGIIAQSLGFAPLFVVVSACSFVGSSWLLIIRRFLTKGGTSTS